MVPVTAQILDKETGQDKQKSRDLSLIISESIIQQLFNSFF
jgi:hypothetical protein